MSKKQSGWSPEVASVRGIMACLVAYCLHWQLLMQANPSTGISWLDRILSGLATFTIYGSDIFFLFSGYLTEKAHGLQMTLGEIPFRGYMGKKIRKIYPLMIVTAIVAFSLQHIGVSLTGSYLIHADGGELRNSVPALIVSLLGLQGGIFSEADYMSVNGPAWFITILLICGMLHWFLARICGRHRIRFAVYMGVMIAGGIMLEHAPGFPFLYATDARGYFSYFAGVLLFDGMHAVGELQSEIRSRRTAGCIYAASLICTLVTILTLYHNRWEAPHVLYLDSIVIWPLLAYYTVYGHLLRYILRFPPFVWLGKMSMPIFLCNYPTDAAIRLMDLYFGWNLDYTSPAVWWGHVTLSIGVAWVMNVLVNGLMHFFSRGKPNDSTTKI